MLSATTLDPVQLLQKENGTLREENTVLRAQIGTKPAPRLAFTRKRLHRLAHPLWDATVMNTRLIAAPLVALAVISLAAAASEKQYIEFADLASGKTQIIGRLGIPIGQVVRVEATVIAAEKLWPDSSEFRERYILSIHTIAGREVSGVYIPFRVHRFAVSKLFPGRIELGGKLQDMLNRKPTETEISKDPRGKPRGI